MTSKRYPVKIKGKEYKNVKEFLKEKEKQEKIRDTYSEKPIKQYGKIDKLLKQKFSNKRLLKKEKPITITIKSHKNIPYKSNYFKEEEIQMKNDFLFGK